MDGELDPLAHDVIVQADNMGGSMVGLLETTNMVQDLSKTILEPANSSTMCIIYKFWLFYDLYRCSSRYLQVILYQT